MPSVSKPHSRFWGFLERCDLDQYWWWWLVLGLAIGFLFGARLA